MNALMKRCLCFLLVFTIFFHLFSAPGEYKASEYEPLPSLTLEEYFLDFYLLHNDHWVLESSVESFWYSEYNGYFLESYPDHKYPNAKVCSYFFFDASTPLKKGSLLNFESFFELESMDGGDYRYTSYESADLYGLGLDGEWYLIKHVDSSKLDCGLFVFEDFYLFRDVTAFRVDYYFNFESFFTDNPYDQGRAWYILYSGDYYEIYGDGPEVGGTSSGGGINNDLQQDQINLTNNIFENIKIIAGYIWNLPSNIAALIGNFFSNLGNSITTLQTNIKSYFDVLGALLVTSWEAVMDDLLSALPDDIESSLRSSFDGLKSGISSVGTGVKDLRSAFESLIKDLKSALTGNLSELGSFIVSLPSGIEAALSSSFSSIVSGLQEALSSIVDGIASLFIPKEGFFLEAYDLISSKIPFVKLIVDFIQSSWGMFTVLALNECPEPYVLSVEYHGVPMDITILDLSWYTPYKPYVDFVLSAFIILGFVWSLFLHLPGILNGVSNTSDTSCTDIAKGGDVE